MDRRIASISLAVTMFVAVWQPTPARAAPGTTTSLSRSANGATPATSVPDTTSPNIALDGHCIAFSSEATNLVSGDTNGAADIFLKDLNAGTLRRVSVSRSGAQANGPSYSPSLSVDCRWLAFASKATNLVSGDANGAADIFLKNLKTGAVSLASVTSREGQANADSNTPFVSLFGEWIVFESAADNIDITDDNAHSDVFIRHVRSGRTERVVAQLLADDDGPGYERFWTQNATISYDGRYVTYTRAGARLDPLHVTSSEVFVLDRRTRKHLHLRLQPWGGAAKAMADHAVISADGRYVAFEVWSDVDNRYSVEANSPTRTSPAGNDDAIAKNPFHAGEIRMYDRQTKTFVYLSVNAAGDFAQGGDCSRPSISANGHVVAYQCDATNLVAGDTNNTTDVFVRDLDARTTSRASLDNGAGEANGRSFRPSLSYEGRRVAFVSDATDLSGSDPNNASDVFIHDRRTNIRNRAPTLRAPITGKRYLNVGEEITFALRATDPDRDRMRYDLLRSPPTAELDPSSGNFTWRPTVADAKKEYKVAFYVEDPRGNFSIAGVILQVRDNDASVQCEVLGQCTT